MKYVLVALVSLFLGAGGMFLILQRKPEMAEPKNESPELATMKETVQRRLSEMSDDISNRLKMFSQEVASDQLFSLRLLVENNPSAPEVTNKAVQFLKPMGFSLLDVADSGYTLLSCGQFPASVGTSVEEKGVQLSETPVIIPDKVMGKDVLSFQAKYPFRIAESLRFFAIGGIIIDEAWLRKLAPREGVTILLKKGASVMGMEDVRTISEVKDGNVLINDKEYQAAEIPLPWIGGGDAPSLIAILNPK